MADPADDYETEAGEINGSYGPYGTNGTYGTYRTYTSHKSHSSHSSYSLKLQAPTLLTPIVRRLAHIGGRYESLSALPRSPDRLELSLRHNQLSLRAGSFRRHN